MKLVYEGKWNTHEEWGGILIFQDSNEVYYAQDGGHSVYSDLKESDWNEPYIVSFATVLELIDEWGQIEKQNEEYWENSC